MIAGFAGSFTAYGVEIYDSVARTSSPVLNGRADAPLAAIALTDGRVLFQFYEDDAKIYAATLGDAVVRKIPVDGTISTVFSEHAAGLNRARLAVDRDNTLHVIASSVVYKVSSDGKRSIVAGGGMDEVSANGGPAILASLGVPQAIATDDRGNLYIAAAEFDDDYYGIEHGYVWIVTPDGLIKTFAGTGTDGYSGDGGPATAAQIGSWIPALAVDGSRNLLIVDARNQAIRKVTPDAIITSIQKFIVARRNYRRVTQICRSAPE